MKFNIADLVKITASCGTNPDAPDGLTFMHRVSDSRLILMKTGTVGVIVAFGKPPHQRLHAIVLFGDELYYTWVGTDDVPPVDATFAESQIDLV